MTHCIATATLAWQETLATSTCELETTAVVQYLLCQFGDWGTSGILLGGLHRIALQRNCDMAIVILCECVCLHTTHTMHNCMCAPYISKAT